MSGREIGAAALRQMLAANTSEVFLVLLTLTHPSMTTLRVVNNTQSIVSRGNAYVAFPFSIALPQDVAERLATVQLTISNVDRRLVDEVRAIPDPISVTVEVIAASAPNAVEVGPFIFDMVGVDGNVNTLTATLSYEPLLNEPFPAGTFNPQEFPGLFGNT